MERRLTERCLARDASREVSWKKGACEVSDPAISTLFAIVCDEAWSAIEKSIKCLFRNKREQRENRLTQKTDLRTRNSRSVKEQTAVFNNNRCLQNLTVKLFFCCCCCWLSLVFSYNFVHRSKMQCACVFIYTSVTHKLTSLCEHGSTARSASTGERVSSAGPGLWFHISR